VINVETSRSASSGMTFGSSILMVRVSGVPLGTKGRGVGSTERIFRSGGLLLALAFA